MARRVDHSHEELNDMILSAARLLVEEGGYPALSVRKIANIIGYSPGTIYNVFTNLDDLVLQLNARTLDALYLSLPKPNSSSSVEENFDNLLCRYLSFVGENRRLWRVLFDHRPSSEAALPDWYNARVEILLTLIDSALKPGFSRESPKGLRKISTTLWAGLHGILSLADGGKLDVVSDEDPLDLCRLLTKSFLNGVDSSSSDMVGE